jgi:hypothetical protein
MPLDTEQLIRRTQVLYGALPDVGFTSTTFEELGNAARLKLPYRALSQQLRGTLMLLTRRMFEAVAVIEVEEMLARAAEESSPMETAVTAPPVPLPPVDPAAPMETVIPETSGKVTVTEVRTTVETSIPIEPDNISQR